MLVDLAGSESSKRSSARFKSLEEFNSINLSLSALGNCVAALAKVGTPAMCCSLKQVSAKDPAVSETYHL